MSVAKRRKKENGFYSFLPSSYGGFSSPSFLLGCTQISDHVDVRSGVGFFYRRARHCLTNDVSPEPMYIFFHPSSPCCCCFCCCYCSFSNHFPWLAVYDARSIRNNLTRVKRVHMYYAAHGSGRGQKSIHTKNTYTCMCVRARVYNVMG